MALTNSQYQAIMRTYDEKQARNRADYNRKMADLYAKEPRFEELDKKISSAALDKARLLLDGDTAALDRLKKQLDGFRKERATLFSDLGYKESDFEMTYSCPDCKDTGYIDDRKCHCFKQASIDMLYTQSNIRQILEEENFSTFSYDYYSDVREIENGNGITEKEYMHSIVTSCKKFVENFDSAHDNILFKGPTGVGKTFLSHCIAKELIESSHSVIYFSASALFDILSKNTFDRESDASEDVEHIYDCDLLVIDDLGSEFSNSFTVSQLFSLLNERLLRRKSTIISTNLSSKQLTDVYTERATSRIFSNYITFTPQCADIRMRKNEKRGLR